MLIGEFQKLFFQAPDRYTFPQIRETKLYHWIALTLFYKCKNFEVAPTKKTCLIEDYLSSCHHDVKIKLIYPHSGSDLANFPYWQESGNYSFEYVYDWSLKPIVNCAIHPLEFRIICRKHEKSKWRNSHFMKET